jgi:hypothetical protein
MKQVRLIYCSNAVGDISDDLVSSILVHARQKNQRLGVTGMLCHCNQSFVQCLEGDYFQVNRIYNAIIADNRHERQSLLSYEEISDRVFPDFSMGLIDDPLFINEALHRTTHEEFSLSLTLLGQVAVEFMQKLSTYQR